MVKKVFWNLKGLILIFAIIGVGISLFQFFPFLRIDNFKVQKGLSEVDKTRGAPVFRITLEYPVSIHLGDTETIKLVIEPVDQEWVNSMVENHSVLFGAKLVMDGLTVKPQNLITEAYQGEGNPVFYWKFTPTEIGKLGGQVWVYVYPMEKGVLVGSLPPISAQHLDINVSDSFGFPASYVRVTGLFLLLLSAAFLIFTLQNKSDS